MTKTQHLIQSVPNLSIDINFWELNPQLKVISPFSTLYKRDKSRNKETSSKEAWCIFQFSDPSHVRNKLARLPTEDRIEEITNHFYKIDWNDKVVKECIDEYPNICLTVKERMFKTVTKKLEERESFLASTPYNEDTVSTIEKMIADTKKVMDSYKQVEQDMLEEEIKISGKGNRKLSKYEQGDF